LALKDGFTFAGTRWHILTTRYRIPRHGCRYWWVGGL